MSKELKGAFENFNKGTSHENDLDKKYRLPKGGVKKLRLLEEQYDLPRGILLAVSSAESGGEKDRAKATSRKGAKGWFQFIPETAKAFKVNPRDFNSSAEGAAKMFAGLNKQYKGNLDKMLAAYNWGSGNVARKGLENMPEETRNYLTKVKERIKEYIPPTENKSRIQKTQSEASQERNNKEEVGFPMNLLSPSFKKLLKIEEAKVESFLPNKEELSKMSFTDIFLLREKHTEDSRVQQELAPYEHRAFAREYVQEGSTLAKAIGLSGAIPAYYAAKKVGVDVRTSEEPSTPADIEQVKQSFIGVGEGLKESFDNWMAGL